MAQVRPTFSESWYRVADLRIKLRGSAQISRQFYRGDRWYVVRDPAGNQFHRLSAPAYRFVGLLDGTRTVAEAWDLVGGQLADDAPTQNEVIQILSQLHAANLLESNVTPDAQVLLRRHKRQQRQKLQGRLMNILFPRIPLWDPDRFLVRWMPVMRTVFLSWFGALLWLGVVIAAIMAVAPEWTKLKAAAQNTLDPTQWPFLWATFVLIKAIHELGHAFTCRRFGGEVHELGVMFLVMVPAPYVDASSAWSFPSKWQKILVGAGGMIFELFVAAIMAFVWLNTAPGLINQLAYNTMLIASVSTVIFNANPLLRYDGYYMLSDLLEIPNLRMRATEYTMGLIKRHLFRTKQHQPLPPLGQRFWLFFYAVTSTVYRTWVGIMIILLVWTSVPILGVLMALGGVVTWLVVPVVKTSKYLLLDPELHRKRARAFAWTGAFVAAVVILVGGVKVATHYEAMGVLEPTSKQIVYARGSGIVEQVVAQDGQWVKKGDVILIAKDERLQKELEQRQYEYRAMERQWSLAYNEPSRRILAQEQMNVLAKEIKRLEERQGELTLVADAEGQLIAPDLKHLKGRFLSEAEEVGKIGKFDQLRIVSMVPQTDAALAFLYHGREAEVMLPGEMGRHNLKAHFDEFDYGDGGSGTSPTTRPAATRPLKGQRMPAPQNQAPHPALTQVAGGPHAVDPSDPDGRKLLQPQIQFWLTMDNPDRRYLPGQRAHLRFKMEEQPLIVNWSRRVWQLIQAHSSSKWI